MWSLINQKWFLLILFTWWGDSSFYGQSKWRLMCFLLIGKVCDFSWLMFLKCRRWRGLNPCAYNMQQQLSGLYHLLLNYIIQRNLLMIQKAWIKPNGNQARSWSQPPEIWQSLILFCKSKNNTFAICIIYFILIISCHVKILTKINDCRKFEKEFNTELQSLGSILSSNSQAEPYLSHLAQWLLGVKNVKNGLWWVLTWI